MTVLRIGARGSDLSRIQVDIVRDALTRAHPGIETEFIPISTKGDLDRESPLASGTGWFTTAIQQSLTRGEIDIAVHSYKDLPTKRPDGLVIAAVPARADPRDALVSQGNVHLRDLPPGTRVGTGSPRRRAQVLAVNPDVTVESIRGNVETRLRKVMSGEYDAAVLALAGIQRLGLESAVSQVLGLEEMLPAPAQGALAVECRASDSATLTILRSIDAPELRATVAAERSFLARLEAGCDFPAAAAAEVFGTTLKLNALIAPDGRIVRSKIGGAVAHASGLGAALADELLRLSES